MKVNIRDLLRDLDFSDLSKEEPGVVSATRIKELTMQKINENKANRLSHAGRRVLTLALAAALLLALGVTAYALGVRIIFREEPMLIDDKAYTSVHFDATDHAPVFLGVWELSQVPDGFLPVKNYYTNSEARTDYNNKAGDIISLIYQKAGHLDAYFDQPILFQEDVSINGNPGRLYVVDNGWSYLFWTHAERGIGFQLSVKGDYSLLTLAESVFETDVYPPMDDNTIQALAELGDWQPVLPEGYTELVTYGMSGDFAYLCRTFSNEKHYEIQLNYEKAVSDLEGYVSYYRSEDAGYGVIRFSPVTINGMDGWLMENEDGTPFRIVWLDSVENIEFQLSTNELDSKTLLDVAQSITKQA